MLNMSGGGAPGSSYTGGNPPPVQESREERMIRQKYEMMIKKEEQDRRRRDRLRQAKLDEITKEPQMQMGGVGQRPMSTWQDNSANQSAIGGQNQNSNLQSGQFGGSYDNAN